MSVLTEAAADQHPDVKETASHLLKDIENMGSQ